MSFRCLASSPSARRRSRRSIAAAVCVPFVLHAPAGAAPPTAQEQTIFNAVRARLNGHSAQMPHGVGGADASLEDECFGMSFKCPPPAEDPAAVTFIICTRLVHWVPNPEARDEAAAYVWDRSPTVTSMDGIKTIQYDNEIMIDASVFKPNETNALGMLLNEGLLYHELLHGQLGIDFAFSDAAIAIACACNTPDPGAHSDAGHTQIPDLQNTYLTNVGNLAGDTIEVFDRIIAATQPDGSFTIDLGDKNFWTGTVLVPEGGNVTNAMISDPGNDGSIILTGMLTNPAMKGHVIVLIDPPSLFLYFFVQINVFGGSTCGNFIPEPGEECDPPSPNGVTPCNTLCVRACPGDCASPGSGLPDGVVGVDDFLQVLAEWNGLGGQCDFMYSATTFGADGDVGINEFLEVLAEWQCHQTVP